MHGGPDSGCDSLSFTSATSKRSRRGHCSRENANLSTIKRKKKKRGDGAGVGGGGGGESLARNL